MTAEFIAEPIVSTDGKSRGVELYLCFFHDYYDNKINKLCFNGGVLGTGETFYLGNMTQSRKMSLLHKQPFQLNQH